MALGASCSDVGCYTNHLIFFGFQGNWCQPHISPISAPSITGRIFLKANGKTHGFPATLEGEDLSELLGQLLPNEVDEKRGVLRVEMLKAVIDVLFY